MNKRVLLVKPVLPYPPVQGTKVLSFGVIESLAEEFDVTVLARILDPAEREHARALEAWCSRVVTVLPPNRRGWMRRVAYKIGYIARSLVGGRSLKSLYDCPGAFIRAARELAGEPFDLVILEYWQLYPLLDVFPRSRTVLLTHDIDLAVNRERVRFERSPLARARAMRRWRVERREEVQAYRTAKRVWALTGRDADAVRALTEHRTQVDVLPFGLSASSFVEHAGPRTSNEVLFLGAMSAAFNRDAIGYFVRDIYPQLATIPDLRVTVVGGGLPPEVASFASAPGVEVSGHTPDPRTFLSRAACLVVPLRFGGGLRIRVLEAMAAGLPVVCSPLAVEGMGLESGMHVLIARDPGEYRRHVERLLRDRAFAAALAERARERVWGAYGPSVRGEGLRAWVRREVTRQAPGGEGK
jgi:glycosyltransferase involved in cell wall biosynthesis